MSDLKPCPFCGSEAVLNHSHMITATGQYLANVKCSECGIASRVVWSTDSPEEAVKEAIEAWNRRTERMLKVEIYTDDQQETYGECECGIDVYPYYTYCPGCGAKLDWSE